MFKNLKKRKKISLKKFNRNYFSKTKKHGLSFLKKLYKKVVIFFEKIKKIIQHNKLLNNSTFTRIVTICFFFGLNIILLPYFLETTRVKLPGEFLDILDELGIIDKNNYVFEYVPPQLKENNPSLEPKKIFEKLNEQRTLRELDSFEYSDRLASAAAVLLEEARKYDFELENKSFIEELRTSLDDAGYDYSHVSHNMVIGPLSEDAVIDAWLSDEKQLDSLFNQDFKDVGFVSTVYKTKYDETVGIVVQILASEFDNPPPQNVQIKQTQVVSATKPFPYISDQEVFEALNIYRAGHSVYPLELNNYLCEYAGKRLVDQINFGGLDNHQGFKDDFANPEELPLSIKNYGGRKIAENLAYQNCRNMTTGDSFIAQTGISIIEWCFDSSTEGHREAQLSTDFEDVCVRGGDGYFVVIFGDR